MSEHIDIDIDEHELRLFKRLLLSYNDFKQAHEVAIELLEGGHYDNYEHNRTLLHALNLTVIIAYSRPFKVSRGQLALKSLPLEILSNFDHEQMDIHQQVLCDRDTMMAHSDSDANNALPQVLSRKGKKILIPINTSPYAIPLLREAMEKLANMAFLLQEKVFEMRMDIQPRIIDKLPAVQIDSEI
jgi:hypothetical protein